MADEALFLGWGEIVSGRERKALDVFNESVQYYGQLQEAGRRASRRGSCRRTAVTWRASSCCAGARGARRHRAQPGVRAPPDEAAMIAERTGTLNAYTGEPLAGLMGQFEEATGDLGG